MTCGGIPSSRPSTPPARPSSRCVMSGVYPGEGGRFVALCPLGEGALGVRGGRGGVSPCVKGVVGVRGFKGYARLPYELLGGVLTLLGGLAADAVGEQPEGSVPRGVLPPHAGGASKGLIGFAYDGKTCVGWTCAHGLRSQLSRRVFQCMSSECQLVKVVVSWTIRITSDMGSRVARSSGAVEHAHARLGRDGGGADGAVGVGPVAKRPQDRPRAHRVGMHRPGRHHDDAYASLTQMC
jgi:hypothetical protein